MAMQEMVKYRKIELQYLFLTVKGQTKPMPVMLASKEKVAKSQVPVCQYQSSFSPDVKASASKPGWRSIKHTSNAQLS